ncbi:MAG: phosphatidate cytidylyltransferase [Prevotellaceae bacterium]|jgi:phosphatidate cytidylyltransferase|nr:phosphatidate cytidylyltransferase [Prevotellaceae bacterium]
MKTLIIRTLSGAVYVGIIVAAIMTNGYIFAVVFSVLSALTTFEFHKLTNKQENVNVPAWIGLIASALLFITFALINDIFTEISLILYCAFVFSIFIAEIFRKNQNIVHNIAYFLLGQIYIALPFTLMIFIYQLNTFFLLALFVIIWANDTFAYLAGSLAGKHKMCKDISPKKSWEGFLGGMAGALVAGFVFYKFCPVQIHCMTGATIMQLWQWFVFALIIVIFGTLGDLFESKIKRTVGVKDSGNIMPGHGGLLDRFDSLLFAVVPAMMFLVFAN